ncbi:hypothetical protein [Nannocystis pusilla]|uniref:Uncharacterized protein n=1 Tax=Nannocystis pusilla TaxID=889268 RepID=A0ABS7TUB1_9BACT|nr:hypothetical protein [Nannocystis pusilla]MBZ5711813.1 hypothetical protein [Nannocystis pusilla]
MPLSLIPAVGEVRTLDGSSDMLERSCRVERRGGAAETMFAGRFRRAPRSGRVQVMSDAPLVGLYSLGFGRRFALSTLIGLGLCAAMTDFALRPASLPWMIGAGVVFGLLTTTWVVYVMHDDHQGRRTVLGGLWGALMFISMFLGIDAVETAPDVAFERGVDYVWSGIFGAVLFAWKSHRVMAGTRPAA